LPRSALSPGFAALYLGFFVFNGMAESPFLAVFNDQVPSGTRSTMLSLSSFVLQAGALGGSLGFGYLAKSASIPPAWLAAPGVLGVSSLAYLGLPGALRRSSEQPR